MELLPEWAPGWHPLIIHFPVALLSLAVGLTVVEVFYRPAWLTRATAGLYLLGWFSTLAAYLSGRAAADSIGLNLKAEAAISAHSDWGLYTLLGFAVLTVVYILIRWVWQQDKLPIRLLLAVLAITGFLVLAHTAEYGGRLVFEFGLGVK